MPDLDCEIAVIGAGPYGLGATIQLRRQGTSVAVFGDPMSFWRSMPTGMCLRSNRSASNMVELSGPYSLDAYSSVAGVEIAEPLPLETFVDYGMWIQRTAVPDVDPRTVRRIDRTEHGYELQLEDGDRMSAGRVVVASGIGSFTARPPLFGGLPDESVSHTGDHQTVEQFADLRVAVIGGGQSALEWATLLHEAGASVEVIVRKDHLTWLRGYGVKKRLGSLGPILYAPTDVGPLWYSRLVERPHLFRKLPRATQTRIARRCIRPAVSNFVRVRVDSSWLCLGHEVTRVRETGGSVELQLDDDSRRLVDRVIVGTGYRVDVAELEFLPPSILVGLERRDGYPVLRRGFESSVPGLHFLGAPAAWSFGPIMRFVSGSWFSGRELADAVAGDRTQSGRTSSSRPAARPGRVG